MHKKHWIVLLITICFGWGIVASVSAQRCTDPTTGGAIPCPNNKDDKPDKPQPTSTPSNDRDGDGLSNESDRCPDEGGHERNQGCPEDSTDNTSNNPSPEPPVILPTLPLDGRCMLATKSKERVNVRDIPSLNGQVIAQLDPQLSYPVHLHLLGAAPNNDDWFLISLGWVSETVVRLGGDCEALPTHYLGLSGVMLNHASSIRRISPDGFDPASAQPLPPFYLQFCDGSVKIMQTAISDCDGSVMPFDGLQSFVECDGSVHDISEELGDCPESASNMGLLLNDANEVVIIAIKFDFDMGAFNPQPEPPSPAEKCLTSMGLPSNGLTEKGFNPQPEPPADGASSNQPSTGLAEKGFNPQPDPPCMFVMNMSNFGGEGLALLGGEQGIIIVNGYGGPNANELGIIINGYGGPNANELGIILVDGYGGPNANEQGQKVHTASDLPADMKWTGIGNAFVIGESEGQVFVCPASKVGFNPQPDPPGEGETSNQPSTGLEEVGFNPQPEPPADGLSSNQPSTGLAEVGFNPQPDPPGHCFNVSVGI